MKEHVLLEAFEQGTEEGRKDREVQTSLLDIWKLVANQFTADFDVVHDPRNKVLSITAGKKPANLNDFDFDTPNITVKESGDGTFQVNTGYQNMGVPPLLCRKNLEGSRPLLWPKHARHYKV